MDKPSVVTSADELAGKSVGERIQIIRERTGKTRETVAGLVGKSPEWLRSVEKGRRQPPGLPLLLRLGQVLGVHSLTELVGDNDLMPTTQRRALHPVVPDIREAIEGIELVAVEPSITPAELGERVERAWRLWHTSSSPRADAGAMLPGIIREGRRAVRVLDGTPRRDAAAALTGAYVLSEQVLAWVADSPLLWLAADRAMATAEIADRPAVLAAASWVLGNVWRATGREDDAWRLAQDAVALLDGRLDDGARERALWGSCQLHSAITAAKLGREGDALRCLDAAISMAASMPEAYAHPWTLFGSPNAELTGVSVQVELRKGGSALENAARVDPDSIASVDRRARLYLEGARAYRLGRDWSGTLGMLSRGTEISQESMGCHPLARSLAGELVIQGGRLVERDARALAARIGITV